MMLMVNNRKRSMRKRMFEDRLDTKMMVNELDAIELAFVRRKNETLWEENEEMTWMMDLVTE